MSDAARSRSEIYELGDVPELGVVTLEARPAGSVYLAKAKVNMQFEPPEVELKLLDADPMNPTAGFAKAPSK